VGLRAGLDAGCCFIISQSVKWLNRTIGIKSNPSRGMRTFVFTSLGPTQQAPIHWVVGLLTLEGKVTRE